ncbi:MAG: hypothetical protein IJS71_06335 [Clostridia bacterium]|nr:hypothetical protein [Clostridia bacterium]
MKTMKYLKAVIASLLVLACVLSLLACNKKPSKQNDDGVLPQQHINQRYYFQQGYRTDWDVLEVDADKYMLDRDTGLVMVLAPVETEKDDEGNDVPVKVITKDADGNDVESHKAIEGVEYCIYYYNGEGVYMTTSRADIVGWLSDPSSKHYFNSKHFRGAPRETYLTKDDPILYTAKWSKLQFTSQTYTFTKDGEDYRGIYNIVMSGLEYFVITFEAKADLYDYYYEYYEETIGDFRKKGWETSDVG